MSNTSSPRAGLDALALLPSARYSLAVQAINSVGHGPASEYAAFATAAAAAAAYELKVGDWAHATIHRGVARRHRFFAPAASESCRVEVQLHALGSRVLIQVERAQEPTLLLPEDLPPHAAPGRWNVSGDDGSLSLQLTQPALDWYYLLLHGAALTSASVGADLRVSCASAADVVVGRDGLGMSSARYGDLAPSWRYMVDSVGGGSQYAPWVLNRHAHPLSAVPSYIDE